MLAEEDACYFIGSGLHSNIPDCCIKFFVTTWYEVQGSHRVVKHYYDLIRRYHYNYVPCPKCLGEGVKVTMHKCDPDSEECRKWWRPTCFRC
jgi:hypothetical protein